MKLPVGFGDNGVDTPLKELLLKTGEIARFLGCTSKDKGVGSSLFGGAFVVGLAIIMRQTRPARFGCWTAGRAWSSGIGGTNKQEAIVLCFRESLSTSTRGPS